MLTLNTDLYKRTQTKVNRTLEGTGLKVRLPELREYVSENYETISQIGSEEEFVSHIEGWIRESVTEATLSIPCQSHSQEIDYVVELHSKSEVLEKQEQQRETEDSNSLALPDPAPLPLAIPELEVTATTAKLGEVILQQEVIEAQESAIYLKQGLEIIRQFRNELLTDIVAEHKVKSSGEYVAISNALDGKQDTIRQTRNDNHANLVGKLKDIQKSIMG